MAWCTAALWENRNLPPPELQGHFFVRINRAPEHDLFGLAVLIFQLLMEGTHPFAGLFLGKGDPPPYEARISAGHFPYSRSQCGPYRPMPSAPPVAILHPHLQELFICCFDEGHHHPSTRPDAQTWQHALQEAENALVACAHNDQHLYSNHLSACPWCERSAQLQGRDPFPSRQAMQRRPLLTSSTPATTPRPSSGTPVTASPTPRSALVTAQSTTASAPPHAVPGTASPVPKRPSRLASTVTGALGGAVSGLLLEMVVRVVLDPRISQLPLPPLLLEALMQSGWGAVWGAVWGTLWGALRLPAVSGHSNRLRRMFTGALLGACLGIITSVLVGMTPGNLVET